ncbi:DUF1304 domain-containing protein [Ochrobactrum sp. Marseille-Q0166]|uniref:DUF1304 domain-containing protein n=1 Tax=Ochrobactrum sp. Marseille-Q0166 TaxID=2761105 RepID=UPI001654E7FF|nr:DUF1304 domain-containing protein [Ochrobactrum sp. Marseille-Q0166]MBC8718967.1 DUF1304 domain-containing protein [Ochrobactrum sp. Marseille-Q0166]
MIANILIALIAALHIYILVLEMFLWTRPQTRRAFNLSPDFASQTKVLAGNQGLYNGFLAAGLIVGLFLQADGYAFKLFFLICVAVAGIYGSATVSRKIAFVQTVPAVLALCALWAGI